jgi:hypothetical protein
MNSRKREYLLYIVIIFLLVAQYVANDRPWDRIFRWTALLTLVGVWCRYLLFTLRD